MELSGVYLLFINNQTCLNMDVQISTLKPSAFYLGFECLNARMEWWWTVVWWCHLFYKKPLGAMDTYCDKRGPSCSVHTHLGCSFSASLLFSLFCSSLLFAFFEANVTEPEVTKAQEPTQSDTLCPFLSFLTRFSPLSRLELILCEWIEICVDVCALHPKIWRGREGREAASRGGPCDWPCPSPVELWTPAYTYSKHTYIYWIYRPSEQYNTVPFFV